MTPRESKACDRLNGHRLYGGFTVLCGQYGGGEIALQAIGEDGIPECTITVNLPDERAEGEFFVRFETRTHASHVIDALISEGIAAPTGRVVGAGRVERYAEAWRLAGFE